MKRAYSEAERQTFAQYVDYRARHRPVECCGGLDCWVEWGPPSMETKGGTRRFCCVGCEGVPRFDKPKRATYRR